MNKVSFLIPSRNEELLVKTIDDIFAKATGEIEVIAVVDGPTAFPLPAPRANLSVIIKQEPLGLRSAINDAAAIASGQYLCKVDGHCTFAQGFDEVLQADCEPDWVVVPRLNNLDGSSTDYYYLSCPWNHPKYFQMQSCPWNTRTKARPKPQIDAIMAFQGSMWFMHTRYWRQQLHGIAPETTFGPFCEHQEISLKTWLGGGQVMVNKKTWYVHNHQANTSRGYHRSSGLLVKSHIAVAHYFADNQWPKRIHNFAWLIDRFWPLPTEKTLGPGEIFYWPEDWKSYYA